MDFTLQKCTNDVIYPVSSRANKILITTPIQILLHVISARKFPPYRTLYASQVKWIVLEEQSMTKLPREPGCDEQKSVLQLYIDMYILYVNLCILCMSLLINTWV